MKKINPMAILIAAVLTLCFTFTSCGKDDEKENDILLGRASNVFTVTPPSPRAMKSTDLKAAIKKRF